MDDRRGELQTLESPRPAPGRPFAGRYHVLEPLGRGASKEVYLAYDERLDRNVALAVVVAGGAGRARVAREAQVTGRLGDLANVVTVHDTGEVEGLPYMVLRAMRGGSLADVLAASSGGRLAVGEAIRLGREIAGALAHAHAHGVIHRDVKPDNVWLDAEGNAALGDFGVAHAGHGEDPAVEGRVVGTIPYLSPEQARGARAGPASDLYALGVTRYELVTGRTPFTASDPASILAQQLTAPVTAPSEHEPEVPAALDRLVLALLSERPQARPASAEVVAGELGAIIGAARAAALAQGRDLVGRGLLMDPLAAAWNRAQGGSPAIVALYGEPGIGKTRCADELAVLAESSGGEVGWGPCAEQEGAPPFWPWVRALRALPRAEAALPELLGDAPSAGGPAGESPEEARFRLFDAVAGLLEEAGRGNPVLIVIDDLHWADRSSLELLVHVARESRRARLMLLVTYRDSAAGEEHLRRALGDLARRSSFEHSSSRASVRRTLSAASSLRPDGAPTGARLRRSTPVRTATPSSSGSSPACSTRRTDRPSRTPCRTWWVRGSTACPTRPGAYSTPRPWWGATSSWGSWPS